MSFDMFTYLTSLAFIYTYGRLAIHFAPGFLHYFLNEPIQPQKQLEKPRVLFHLVGLFFMHLMDSFYSSLQNGNIALQLISSVVFMLGFLVCQFSWTEKFRRSFLAPINNSIKKPHENFNLRISESQIAELYNEMKKYELLDQDKTSLEDFKNVLLENWAGHQSKLHLKMDGPSCREFYDYLVKTFPTSTLTLKNFFNSSKLVLRPDGKAYKYNTIKNAPTRSTYSKRHADLNIIFQKFN